MSEQVRSEPLHFDELLQQRLAIAAAMGARLSELGERLTQLGSANDSGAAEQAILALLGREDITMEREDIRTLLSEILEARAALQHESAAAPMRRAAGGR